MLNTTELHPATEQDVTHPVLAGVLDMLLEREAEPANGVVVACYEDSP